MKSKPFVVISIVLVLVLLVSASALAMSSPNYQLDWYVQMSGGGGGKSSSPSYVANFTIGQTAAGPASSTNFAAGLGYWYGVGEHHALFLPAVSNND